MDWRAESISSRSVNGRFSSMARVRGFRAGALGFGLPRSEVNFPGPFFRLALLVMRRTLEGEGVREVSAEDERPREVEGDIGGALGRRF